MTPQMTQARSRRFAGTAQRAWLNCSETRCMLPLVLVSSSPGQQSTMQAAVTFSQARMAHVRGRGYPAGGGDQFPS